MLTRRKNIPRISALVVLLVLIVSAGVSLGIMRSTHAHATGSKPNVIVKNPYDRTAPPPNCTWFAWQELHDTEKIDAQFSSDAVNWLQYAQFPNAFWSETTNSYVQIQVNNFHRVHQSQDVMPSAGDLMILPTASDYAKPAHVAYVKTFIGGTLGNVEVLEQNYGDQSLPWTKDKIKGWFDIQSSSPHGENDQGRFIHFVAGSTQTPAVGHALPQTGATHSPVVIENANGQEEVFMIGLDKKLYHQWQNSNGSWSGWFSLGGSWPQDPAVDRDNNGVLEVFLVGNTGSDGTATLFHAWQTSPGSNNWTNWSSMPGIWPSTTPSITYNAAGQQEIFMRGLNGQLYHSFLSSNGWTGWSSLGGSFAKDPVAVRNADGREEVFLVGLNSQLYHIWQNSNGSWGNWTSLGGSWPKNPAINLNQNGVMEIFIVGNTGSNGAGLFHAQQTSPGSTNWTGWNMTSGSWPSGVPTVTQNTAGDLEVFMLGLNYHLYHAWQTSPGSSNLTIWYDFGQSWSRFPVVFKRSNGLMDVFLVGLNSVLYHNPQNSNGSWAGASNIGGVWP